MAVDESGDFSGEPLRLARCQLRVVVQPRHGLGPLGQRVGDPPRVWQHRHQSAGGHPRVAQERQIPVRLPNVLGQDAEVEQAHVGVSAVCQPRDEYGQEVALDRGATARALGEGRDVREGADGISIADGGQSVARALGVQGSLILTEGCGGRDDRSVEHVLMQGAHVSAHVVDGRADRVGVGVTRRVHGPPEDAQVAVLVGNQVVAAHAR